MYNCIFFKINKNNELLELKFLSMLKSIKFFIIPIALLISCSKNTPRITVGNGSGTGNGGSSITSDWLIPVNEVLDGGPGKDGIPALENPEHVGVNEINFLADDDLVIGFSSGNQARAYPHKILDWHEIINDELNGEKVAVTYCPLTGTGIGWKRSIDGQTTTFGVSGLLYNTNLIPYDRLTNSNWSQIRLDCVNGQLSGQKVETYHLVETTWKTWKELFSKSSVISSNTGISRNYSQYPYGDYKTNHSKLLFPVTRNDDRLPQKERVLGLIISNKARVFRFKLFKDHTSLINDKFGNKNIVVVGNRNKNFMVAFEKDLGGIERSFNAIDEGENIMMDDKGNKYNLFGVVTEGADKGGQLTRITSFMGYWFSFSAFYFETIIYTGGN